MGRHKLFKREDVTEKALQVFWRKGYLDASLKDLEEATGVFKPALYSEFGDKEGLFLECIRHYRERYSGKLLLQKEPLGWKNIEAFLLSVLPQKGEKGCFETLAFARDIPALKEPLKKLGEENAERIVLAIKDNLTAGGVEAKKAETFAGTIFIFYGGLSVLANLQPRKKLESQAKEFLDQIRG